MSPDEAAAVELTETPAGTRIRLRVKPGARRAELLGAHGGALKLGVTAAPERGKANRAVLKLLARALGVAPSEINLVAGEASQDKTVFVQVPASELRRRLARDTPPGPTAREAAARRKRRRPKA